MKIASLDLKRQYESIREEIDKAVLEVISSQLYILGPYVEAFERSMAKFCRVKHAIGISSGTDAILIALMACGVKRGDEVITTPFTFLQREVLLPGLRPSLSLLILIPRRIILT